eukprot:NODE_2084_length_1302_cov_14.110934_g1896_i0.p2 GENE.NODE_2084_length_1302_cov_14.110934_g1896_i0~~NODE_2084_length_1302_cov_14.110934_g1896_i0.p2  ORF type:complete len:147 (-),score=24.03 NODE_2084_length_1302_cov_14.110934_g1896_i0:834-1274(-)
MGIDALAKIIARIYARLMPQSPPLPVTHLSTGVDIKDSIKLTRPKDFKVNSRPVMSMQRLLELTRDDCDNDDMVIMKDELSDDSLCGSVSSPSSSRQRSLHSPRSGMKLVRRQKAPSLVGVTARDCGMNCKRKSCASLLWNASWLC